MPPRPQLPLWIRLVLALAGLRIIAGLGTIVLLQGGDGGTPSRFPIWIFVLQVAVFGTAAAWLIFGSRNQRRTAYLGGFYLLVASAYGGALLHFGLRQSHMPFAPLLSIFAAVPFEAFLPAFLWHFLDEFPSVEIYWPGARIPEPMARMSAVAGLVLLVANVLPRATTTLSPEMLQFLRYFERNAMVSVFWKVVFGLIVPGIPYMVWRMRYAEQTERRRVRLFVAGFVLGAGPMFVLVLLENLIPPFGRYMATPHMLKAAGLFLFPALLSTPVSTSYSVLVHRALDVRLVVRKALQYVFARYTLVAAAASPFIVFMLYVYAQRQHTIAELLSGSAALTTLSLTALGLVTLQVRQPMLAGLDRRFFREQHDAHRVLAGLADGMRTAETPRELADRVAQELDRALHLDNIAILLAGVYDKQLRVASGNLRPLAPGSVLAARVFEQTQPFEVDWNRADAALKDLPADDRDWLVDGGFRLLVPVVSSLSRPLGLIALSDKRSELPFSTEDRMLLRAIALSVGLVLENRSGRDSASPLRELDARVSAGGTSEATECGKCGHLAEPGVAPCPRCGGAMLPATLPSVIGDKFRVIRRVGAGAMGVVYQGIDLSLQRSVALKTLPRPDASEVDRLRREARAMARVSHPNLAQIHGAESWRGMPILILEFMDGGSLAERLRGTPWESQPTVTLGIALCDALAYLHANGIIHRDIKPANIGFTSEGVPKVLDFGIAKLAERVRALEPSRAVLTDAPTQSASATGSVEHTHRGAGTPLYMSPEALSNTKPQPGFDLWSLCIVLYEALAGRHPYSDTRNPWRPGRAVPDIRTLRPDCPPEIAEFLLLSLSADRTQRPASAAELRARLVELRHGEKA